MFLVLLGGQKEATEEARASPQPGSWSTGDAEPASLLPGKCTKNTLGAEVMK